MNVKEFNEILNGCNKSLQNVLLNIDQEAPALQSAATIAYGEAIGKESMRNNMGLVRGLVLGASNSGKSALINNLARKIIVPEVIHTSTLMPTWIGQTEDYADEGVTVNYFDLDKDGHRRGSMKSKREAIDDFRCYYCYTEKDLADRDRLVKPDRFKSMELNEAYLSLREADGPCKDYALVLVDTLGNGASSVDDEKAQHNMKNCDFAFVLVDPLGNLTDQDIDFFSSTLFNPKVSNIKPEHIVFVINKIDLSPSCHGSIENCKNNVAALLKKAYSGKVPEALYERLCSQIVTYSALYNRLAHCGVYPYKEDAIKINGLTRKELETSGEKSVETIRTIVAEKEEFEEEKSYLPKEMLLKKGYCEELNTMLGKVIGNMFADGTIYDNHLNGTKEMAENIRQAVQNTIAALAADAGTIEAKIEAFKKAKEIIETLSVNYEKESETITRNFPSEVDTYIKNHSLQLMTTSIMGINKMIDGMKIDVPHDGYVPMALMAMTSVEIEKKFLPSLLQPVPKIVDHICNMISANIFKPVQVTKETPYRQIVEKLSQSMNNYITSVLDEIREINSDKRFKVTVVDKSIFEKKISDSLYEMSVLLIIIIQKQIDEIIKTSISSTVRKSLHGWWDSVKIFFGGGNVDKMFEKMEETARIELRNKIVLNIRKRMEHPEGFLGKEATLNLYSLLSKATRDCDNMVKLYLSNIEHELNSLRDHLKDNQKRIDFYRHFAEEKVDKPLGRVIKEIEGLRDHVVNHGIDMTN